MGDYDKKKYTNMVKTGLQNNDYNYKKHPKHPKQKHKVQSGIHIVYQNDSKSDEVEDVNYYKLRFNHQDYRNHFYDFSNCKPIQS
jgi:hypothetical protein